MTAGRDRRIVTGAVMGAIFLSALDVTAVAPAMPWIVGSLGGGHLYAWAFSVYAVLSTTTTPVFGRISDRRGRKPVILFGVAGFLTGSVMAGFAPTMPFFILGRAVQGLGAGALLTTAFTIVGDLYDLEARARIQGYLSGVWGVASVVGPLLGGSLVDSVGWRWIFFLNVPVGLVTAWVIRTRLKESGYPKGGAKLDLLGGTYFSGAILLLLAGLKLDGSARAAALVGAAGAAVLFVLRERRESEPLFDLTLFRIPVYRSANAAGFFAGAVLLSLSAYLPIYVINVRGGTAVLSGLMLTPLSFGWVIAATLSGRLLLRNDYRRLVLPGLLVLAAATFGVSRFGLETPFPWLGFLMFATGIGCGLSFTTFLVAVQEEVETERRGQATSAVQFFRQIGGALGVAVLELIYVSRLSDTALLEAGPDRIFSAAERGELMDGFGHAFLAAAVLAFLALATGALAGRPRRRYPRETG